MLCLVFLLSECLVVFIGEIENIQPLVDSRASLSGGLVLLEGDFGIAAILKEILDWLPFTPSGQLSQS